MTIYTTTVSATIRLQEESKVVFLLGSVKVVEYTDLMKLLLEQF